MFNGFKAVFNTDSRVLILGSFPSVKSREVGFYYGNKQNKFWKVLSTIFCEDIGESIEDKKKFLIKKHIALYDVVAQSDIVGSADSSIIKSNKVIANISFLLPPNTKVEKIICNGKAAYNLLVASAPINLPIIYLPSTSPANVSFAIDRWVEELKFLNK